MLPEVTQVDSATYTISKDDICGTVKYDDNYGVWKATLLKEEKPFLMKPTAIRWMLEKINGIEA